MNFITAKAEGRRNWKLKDKFREDETLKLLPKQQQLARQGKQDNSEMVTLTVKDVEVKSCQSRGLTIKSPDFLLLFSSVLHVSVLFTEM